MAMTGVKRCDVKKLATTILSFKMMATNMVQSVHHTHTKIFAEEKYKKQNKYTYNKDTLTYATTILSFKRMATNYHTIICRINIQKKLNKCTYNKDISATT